MTGCASDAHLSADSEMLEGSVPEVAVEYRIGVDDTIQINVWKNPELSLSVPVRPDGKVSMPLIGDVYAAGFAPEQVAENIEDRLSKYIRNPNVTVIVTGLQSHEYLTRMRITGAVTNAMSLNYRQGMTVLDAILAAGGVNEFASPNRTKLYRKIDGKTRVISIYLGDILYDGELATNIELRPGDIITVPERLF
jgi:polysaccharide export outer membrane protein